MPYQWKGKSRVSNGGYNSLSGWRLTAGGQVRGSPGLKKDSGPKFAEKNRVPIQSP